MASVKSRRPQDSTKRVYYIFSAKWWVYEKVYGKEEVVTGADPHTGEQLLAEVSSGNSDPIYGELDISYADSGSSSYSNQKKISFPLVSLWIDPGSPDDLKSCKLHALLPNRRTVPRNKAEEQDLEFKLDFVENVFGNIELQHRIRPTHTFSVDDRRTVLRYGAESIPYMSYDTAGSYAGAPIYDSKADALRELITVIQKYTTAKIAGIDLINLNAAPDRLLLEMGFVEIKDYMESAPSMWYGDPLKLISLNQSAGSGGSYGYRYSSSKVSEEIVNNFLDILEKELS